MNTEVASALATVEQAIRGPRTTEPEDEAGPPSPERLAEGDDEEPPTSRMLPPPLSMLAIRLNDGAMLVTLEDADDRDLAGREVLMVLVLSDEEASNSRETIDEALSDAAATIIGRLPMKSV